MRQTRWSWNDREYAADLFIFYGLTLENIEQKTGIPKGTLGVWASDDKWTDKRRKLKQGEGYSLFEPTCDYILRTINRMSQVLFESTIPEDLGGDGFQLPDGDIESRMDRLSRVYERLRPMGLLLEDRQRFETTKELKALGYKLVKENQMTEAEVMGAFRLLDEYLNTLATT
jgi:hypothetical protein